jgi:hypothetical protein
VRENTLIECVVGATNQVKLVEVLEMAYLWRDVGQLVIIQEQFIQCLTQTADLGTGIVRVSFT